MSSNEVFGCASGSCTGNAALLQRYIHLRDMPARGCFTFVVSQMVADTTDTIEKHYAAFVPAARDAAQQQMASGLGIEERQDRGSARQQSCGHAWSGLTAV